VTSLDELQLKIVAMIERGSLQILENTWREIEYNLDILSVKTAGHVEPVLHSAALIIIKLFELRSYIP
jgi:hypothetical protein